ncbi:MAG: hypothetical protein GF344_18340 [Chitinivibrionales bacterium]|nr:hypothetical protein [Chitinivibrionales bacterium]
MQRIFTYQRYLLFVNYFAFRVIIGAIALSWLVPEALRWTDSILIGSTTRLSLYLTITFAALGGLIVRIGRELKNTVFIVTNDRLVFRTPSCVRSILFEEVERFRCRRVGWFAGYGELQGEKTTIRLPAVVRDLSGMVSLIRRFLDEAGRDSSYDRKEVEAFVLRSRVNDLSEERTFESMPSLLWIIVATTFFSFVVAFRIWQLPALTAIAWSLVGAVFPVASYLTANRLISAMTYRRMRAGDPHPESLEPERFFVSVGAAAFIAYLVLGIAFKACCRSGGIS